MTKVCNDWNILRISSPFSDIKPTLISFELDDGTYTLGPSIQQQQQQQQQQQPEQTWTDEELALLVPRTQRVDPATPLLFGRGAALNFFDSHLRTKPIVQDKGEFKVFVASGHVRSGKTRLGVELGEYLADSAVYVQLELGNGHGYRRNFDGRYKDNHEERLGGRLLRAYFETDEHLLISQAPTLKKFKRLRRCNMFVLNAPVMYLYARICCAKSVAETTPLW